MWHLFAKSTVAKKFTINQEKFLLFLNKNLKTFKIIKELNKKLDKNLHLFVKKYLLLKGQINNYDVCIVNIKKWSKVYKSMI